MFDDAFSDGHRNSASGSDASSIKSSNASTEGSISEFLPQKDPYFVYKYRSKHHPFPPSTAPYPLCYDRFSLDTASLNNIDVTKQDGTFSLLEATDVVPARTLDVGCGNGYWVLSLAQRWPKTRFVGFDLCPIQPDPFLLDPELASRVTWKHGNFLEPWPFEDRSFDYIFIRNVSSGIPEAKWDHFFQEASRVLAKGGKLECMDEDIIFPRLPIQDPEDDEPSSPSSSTSSVSSSDSDFFPAPIVPAYDPLTGYDEAKLESLYYEVFKSRGINLSPISLIPYYLDLYFRMTSAPPRVTIPLPEEYPHPVRKKGKGKSTDTSTQAKGTTNQTQAHPTKTSQASSSSTTVPSTDNIPNGRYSPSPSLQPGEVYILEPHDINTGSGIVTSPPRPIELDNKALAIHLLIAVNRVLACKEAMWEVLAADNHWKPSEYRVGEAVRARVNFDRAMDVFQERVRWHIGNNLLPVIDSEALAKVVIDEGAGEGEAWDPQPPSRTSTPSKPFSLQSRDSPVTPPSSLSPPKFLSNRMRVGSDAIFSYTHSISSGSASSSSSPRVSSELGRSTANQHNKQLCIFPNPSLVLNSNSTWWEDYPNVSRLLRVFFGVKGATPDQAADTNFTTSSSRVRGRAREQTL